MKRHCESVVVPGLTPPSCNEQNIIMTGNTTCSPCEGSVSIGSNTIPVVGLGALIFIICLVAFIIKVVQKMKAKKKEYDAARPPKVDENNYYGLYYRSDGTRIDNATMEVVDVNVNYES